MSEYKKGLFAFGEYRLTATHNGNEFCFSINDLANAIQARMEDERGCSHVYIDTSGWSEREGYHSHKATHCLKCNEPRPPAKETE